MRLLDELRNYAYSIGIDYLRVTEALPFVEEEAFLRELIAANKYPSLAPRDISVRCHPNRILENARSIISVAMSYLLAEELTPTTDGLYGSVARFARVADYHAVVSKKLTLLVGFLQEKVERPFDYRICVDSGPLLERAAARRAGLGWFGKNNMLYVPDLGSWIVLGEIIADLALPADEPGSHPDCGKCQRCQENCPTGALLRPYQVDATRCLSAVTQMPGYIPLSFRKAVGHRLWGCDTCQEVCPWNLKAVAGRFKWPVAVAAEVDLIHLLTLSKSEFRRLFGGSTLAWRGKTTLRRNAALALGNLGDPCALEALTEGLHGHGSPVVREMCAWAIGEIGGPHARQILDRARKTEGTPMVLETIDRVLDGSS
ncbi:MAG: tRNA epoxyqueuosine(34) reductase QueG [Firmicutes bacterium]|nr:tRNA epoxyqueuosine(34) reductase QueG [Bacillota bacterium]